MRERVAALSGTISIEGLKASSGWRVVVRLPISAAIRMREAVA
jgi:signal transduction histidine kinase